MIKIYSTPTCMYCKTLKEYLKSLNFEYTEIDVSKNHQELENMVKISGQMGVPVIDINGQVVVGFNKIKVDKALKIENK